MEEEIPKHHLAAYQQATPLNEALYAAAAASDAAETRALLDKGACMNWYNEKDGGLTALHKAEDLATLDTLLSFEATDDAMKPLPSILSTTLKATPLHLNAARGALDCVKLLVEKGAVVDARNQYGNTPLMLACVGNHRGVADFLVESGADVKATSSMKQETPLHMAVVGVTSKSRRGADNDFIDFRIVMMLLKGGADVNAQDADGITPLHLLISYPRETDSVVGLGHLLLKHGADPNAKDVNGRRPADLLQSRGDMPDLLKVFQQHELVAH